MNLSRIQQEIANAQQHFDYVEAHPTDIGGLMVLVALQTSQTLYTLAVAFPHTYPNAMPDVFVRRPSLVYSPHRYQNSQICYLHPSLWNPGRHNLRFVIARAAKWLAKYEVYRVTGVWPGAGIRH